MSFRCLFGLHRPMLNSIVKKAAGYTALCDHCGVPIRRSEDGRWTMPEPLASKREAA